MKDQIKLRGSNHFAGRLREGSWWEEGNECLNLYDVNKPPKYYSGTMKEWIEELTTYIDLYPAEWQTVYEQYKAFGKKGSGLQFYRNDEGYLKIVGVDAVYLKVTGEGETLSHTVLGRIGRMLSERAEELFYSYVEYSRMDDREKKHWMESMRKNIQDYTMKKVRKNYGKFKTDRSIGKDHDFSIRGWDENIQHHQRSGRH